MQNTRQISEHKPGTCFQMRKFDSIIQYQHKKQKTTKDLPTWQWILKHAEQLTN